MPHLPIRVRRLLKAGAIFCLSWGSLNAQDPVWQGQKNTKVSDSQQAFCPGPASCGVFFACCCGSWPWWGSCGNRWEVQNSDGGVEDQLQLPGEKKETIKGLEERGVCVCEEMRLKFSAGLLFERRGDGSRSDKGALWGERWRRGSWKIILWACASYPPSIPCFYPIPWIPLIFTASGTRLPVTFKCVLRLILMGDMQIYVNHTYLLRAE